MTVQGRSLQDIDVNQASVQALSGPSIPAQLRVPQVPLAAVPVRPPPSQRQRKKPGPKAKSIRQRVPNNSDSIKPLKRIERSYNRETKIRVLKFYYLHKIPVERYNKVSYYRTPSISETSNTFLIPESTIHGWLKKEKEIVEQECGSHRAKNISFTCKWPELEEQLYTLFLSRRAEGKIVRRGWFRRNATRIFREKYPNAQLAIFVFSAGWFSNFQHRHHITLRVTTNKAQKIPEDYRRLIINWLRFNRRISQPRNVWERDGIISDIGCFLLSNIANLDETPIPFEFLEGKTYDTVGMRTIWAKSTKSGWDKRQASLILIVFADGIPRVKPKLIFHATTGEKIMKKEGHLYDPRVTVEFNSTAYNNEKLFVKQIKEEIVPAFAGRHSLLALDAAEFHKTETVLDTLLQNDIIPSMIPGGCTGLIQPLDISVNQPFKAILREQMEEYIDEEEERGRTEWSVGDRRIMTTICVGRAWEKFCLEKRSIVQASFVNVGLALPIDGSRDSELRIKGFAPEELVIGDWTQGYVHLKDHQLIEEAEDESLAVEFVPCIY